MYFFYFWACVVVAIVCYSVTEWIKDKANYFWDSPRGSRWRRANTCVTLLGWLASFGAIFVIFMINMDSSASDEIAKHNSQYCKVKAQGEVYQVAKIHYGRGHVEIHTTDGRRIIIYGAVIENCR